MHNIILCETHFWLGVFGFVSNINAKMYQNAFKWKLYNHFLD